MFEAGAKSRVGGLPYTPWPPSLASHLCPVQTVAFITAKLLLSILFPSWPYTQQIHCDHSDHLPPPPQAGCLASMSPGVAVLFPGQFVHLRGL